MAAFYLAAFLLAFALVRLIVKFYTVPRTQRDEARRKYAQLKAEVDGDRVVVSTESLQFRRWGVQPQMPHNLHNVRVSLSVVVQTNKVPFAAEMYLCVNVTNDGSVTRYRAPLSVEPQMWDAQKILWPGFAGGMFSVGQHGSHYFPAHATIKSTDLALSDGVEPWDVVESATLHLEVTDKRNPDRVLTLPIPGRGELSAMGAKRYDQAHA